MHSPAATWYAYLTGQFVKAGKYAGVLGEGANILLFYRDLGSDVICIMDPPDQDQSNTDQQYLGLSNSMGCKFKSHEERRWAKRRWQTV